MPDRAQRWSCFTVWGTWFSLLGSDRPGGQHRWNSKWFRWKSLTATSVESRWPVDGFRYAGRWQQNSFASPTNGGTQVIEEPPAQSTLPPKPLPKTVFVFANGGRLAVDHYTIHAGLLHLAVVGQQRTIALSTLDIKTTIAVNHERGIDPKIPQNRSEVFVAF